MLSSKNLFKLLLFTFPLAIKTPIAIGKSKLEPSFLILAGARFIIILLLSVSNPEFFIAVLTLSFDSFILASGSPTISKQGIPFDISTSIFIKYPFKP